MNKNDKQSSKSTEDTKETGKIIVAKYDFKNKKIPDTPGFVNVVIDQYHDLSPNVLKIDGKYLTNIWEFSKIYLKVKAQKQTWWNHQAEVHIENNKIEKAYWLWRNKGMVFNYPVRYPNDSQNRNKYQSVIRQCVNELDIKSAKNTVKHTDTVLNSETKTYEIMDHVTARIKLIYPTYFEAIKKEKTFIELKSKVDKGTKLIIYDIDGPFTTKENGVKCINNNRVECTKENITEMLKSKNHTFSAGFCLAIALLGKEEWLSLL